MPYNLITRARASTTAITVIDPLHYRSWLKGQSKRTRHWLKATGFGGGECQHTTLPSADGKLAGVVFCQPADGEIWSWSGLAAELPHGSYRIDDMLDQSTANRAALGWAMASYAFTRYGKPKRRIGNLVWPAGADQARITAAIEATFLVRDLINTPAADMGPSQLADEARTLAQTHGAKVNMIVGDDLLGANYPAIHAVGRAASDPPLLIDLIWGDEQAPKVTLVGKGVCFDSGGLDLKPASYMKLMKKDMGGGAHVLGLAHMIMKTRLNVRLRVLVPTVENAIGSNAYRPLDVVRTRKGLTVEIGNTDAEGRVVLSDALYEASLESPELLMDFATLTGAARVALGTDLPAMFCNDEELALDLLTKSNVANDPMWRLPLYTPYRREIDSKVADLNNVSSSPYGGAITAALFLKSFVGKDVKWAHFDIMGWNLATRAGRPEGGEAMGMRAAYELIAERFGR